jgi:predicted RNA binding protein YcfA (HicA-like mRNA interferase family)
LSGSEAPRKIKPIHHRKLVKIFERDGFTVMRQAGDHLILTKPGIKRPVVIKTSPHTVPVTHILTNLKTAQISRDRYFELLDKI